MEVGPRILRKLSNGDDKLINGGVERTRVVRDGHPHVTRAGTFDNVATEPSDFLTKFAAAGGPQIAQPGCGGYFTAGFVRPVLSGAKVSRDIICQF
jgi:hypothetical protein